MSFAYRQFAENLSRLPDLMLFFGKMTPANAQIAPLRHAPTSALTTIHPLELFSTSRIPVKVSLNVATTAMEK